MIIPLTSVLILYRYVNKKIEIKTILSWNVQTAREWNYLSNDALITLLRVA